VGLAYSGAGLPDRSASAGGWLKKLHQYWKINIHWLLTLRNLLAQPFDRRAIYLLGRI